MTLAEELSRITDTEPAYDRSILDRLGFTPRVTARLHPDLPLDRRQEAPSASVSHDRRKADHPDR